MLLIGITVFAMWNVYVICSFVVNLMFSKSSLLFLMYPDSSFTD